MGSFEVFSENPKLLEYPFHFFQLNYFRHTHFFIELANYPPDFQ